MIKRPIFRPSFEVKVVRPKQVFLLNEHRFFVLEGEVYPLLVPLLDGEHSMEDILIEIGNQAPFQKVLYALDLLEKKGYIVESDDTFPLSVSAFWDYMNLDLQAVADRLRDASLCIKAVGEVEPGSMIEALKEVRIRIDRKAERIVVLTDDYLEPGLETINREALESGRSWMLVKPVGTMLWLGPVFQPGTTGCWECLSQRLKFNRQVERYIIRHKQLAEPLKMPKAALPSTLQLGVDLAATEIAKWVATGNPDRLLGRLVTFDLLSLQTQEHALTKRPQCSVCGDPRFRESKPPGPIVLKSQTKRYRGDGGHRTALPEETFQRYKHHVSPITGAVIFLERLREGIESNLAYTYLAGHNFALGVDGVISLRDNLRSQSGGKGTTEIQAKVSALCEAIERYSGILWGDEYRIQGSHAELEPDAVHPNDCMLFSEEQYRNRRKWNATAAKYHIVPEPFDGNLDIDWSPFWSLTEQRNRYLPTAYCYYQHLDFSKPFYCSPDSNGSAAGNTLEEALLQGLMEVVERDNVAIWWYNRIRRPGVDLDSFGIPYLGELKAYYQSIHRELWVLDVTADFGIPTFAGVSRRTDKPIEDIIVGFGAHLDHKVALLRALTEVNQFLPCVSATNSEGSIRYLFPDDGAIDWWMSATIENQPYLTPDENKPLKRYSDYDQLATDDLVEDIDKCVEILRPHGLEVLVHDQTRPDLGLNVVKVVVPGLRHFWRRLGPGRLYDVPVKLGWIKQPHREDQLNPCSVFF